MSDATLVLQADASVVRQEARKGPSLDGLKSVDVSVTITDKKNKLIDSYGN